LDVRNKRGALEKWVSADWFDWGWWLDADSLENAGSGAGAFVLSWALEGLAARCCSVAFTWLEAVFSTGTFGVGEALGLCLWILWRLNWFWCLDWFCGGGGVSWFLADSATLSWLLEWTDLLLITGLDDGAILAVIHCDDFIVEALVCDTVWVLLVLPGGTGWAYDTLGI
jgi:hypothetical protein